MEAETSFLQIINPPAVSSLQLNATSFNMCQKYVYFQASSAYW